MNQIILLIIVFLGLFVVPQHSKAQDTVITTQRPRRLEPKQLLVGIDVGMFVVAKLRAVPLTFRYGISNKAIGVLSVGYTDFRSDSAGKKATNYNSKGFYINVGADYVLTNKKNLKGIWCAGASIVFSRISESMIYTFAGNSFDDYVGKINRDLSIIGLEMRIGYLYPFTRKIYLHTGFKCIFAYANTDNFRALPIRYIPGISHNALMTHNIIPAFELKLYYKIF